MQHLHQLLAVTHRQPNLDALVLAPKLRQQVRQKYLAVLTMPMVSVPTSSLSSRAAVSSASLSVASILRA